MVTFYKFFKIFLICIVLSSCAIYIKEDYQELSPNSSNNLLLNSKVVICASYYVHPSEIYTQAKLFCSKQNKKPKFIEKKYFQYGSLTNPISYIFICE